MTFQNSSIYQFKPKLNLPFDRVTGKFNIVSARNHSEFLLSQQNHAQRRKSTERQLSSTGKSLEQVVPVDIFSEDESESESMGEGEGVGLDSVTIENEQRRFENSDQSFWDVYNMIQQEVTNVLSRNIKEMYITSERNPRRNDWLRSILLTKECLARYR